MYRWDDCRLSGGTSVWHLRFIPMTVLFVTYTVYTATQCADPDPRSGIRCYFWPLDPGWKNHGHISESLGNNFWVKNKKILWCSSGSGIFSTLEIWDEKFGSEIRDKLPGYATLPLLFHSILYVLCALHCSLGYYCLLFNQLCTIFKLICMSWYDNTPHTSSPDFFLLTSLFNLPEILCSTLQHRMLITLLLLLAFWSTLYL